MMKQFLTDISNMVEIDTQGRPTLVFYKKNTFEAVGQLVMEADNHEGRFGCYLATLSSRERPPLAIDSVEHAKQIITALEIAIQEGWLFTEAQIEKYKGKATDTRRTLKQKHIYATRD